jgi:hypothetical protein
LSEPLLLKDDNKDMEGSPTERNDDRAPLLLAAMTIHGYRGPPAEPGPAEGVM